LLFMNSFIGSTFFNVDHFVGVSYARSVACDGWYFTPSSDFILVAILAAHETILAFFGTVQLSRQTLIISADEWSLGSVRSSSRKSRQYQRLVVASS
jgi:hypothetical protein